MNAARVAQALRDLADAIEDGDGAEAPAAPRRRRERAIPEPSQPIDELARARVQKTLREKGWTDE